MAFVMQNANLVNYLSGRGPAHQKQSVVGVNFNAPTSEYVQNRKNYYESTPQNERYGGGVGNDDEHRLRNFDLCFREVRSGEEATTRFRRRRGAQDELVHGFAAFNGLPKNVHVKFLGVSSQESQIDVASGNPTKIHLFTVGAVDVINNSQETFEFGDAVYWVKPPFGDSPQNATDYRNGDRFVANLKKMKFIPEDRQILPRDAAEAKLGASENAYMEAVRNQFRGWREAVDFGASHNARDQMRAALETLCGDFASFYEEEKEMANEIFGLAEFNGFLDKLYTGAHALVNGDKIASVKARLMTWPWERRQAFMEQHYLGTALAYSEPNKILYLDLKPK